MLKFFERNKFLIVSAALVFFLVVLCWITSYNEKLVTTEAPRKIISLQIAWKAETAHNIVKSWADKKVIDIALQSINIDYVFIVAYTLLLFFCVLARNRMKPDTEPPYLTRTTKVFITLCIVAAGCDVIENVFTTMFIRGEHISQIFFTLPAAIKYAALLAVVGHLILFVRFQWDALRELMKALRTYVAGIVFVLGSYYLFIRVPPGQDVVIQIGEWSGPTWWFLFSIVVWTGITWYSSRVVGYQKFKNLGEPNAIAESLHMHIPRIIAFNALVSIQAAIFALPTIAKLDQCQLWIFVIIQNLFYFVWNKLMTEKQRGLPGNRAHSVVTGLVIGGYLAVAIFLGYRGGSAHQRSLPFIAFFLFALELVLLWLFIIRRAKLKSKPGEGSLVEINVASMTIVTPVRLPAEEHLFFQWFNIAALVGLVIYIASFFSISLDNLMGPLPVALLSFGILLGLSNIISVFSISKKVNFFVLLFVMAIIVGSVYNPYAVRLHEFEDNEHHVERPDLQTYFHLWLHNRESLINDSTVYSKTDTFPVYMVVADGGASRSGYWVSAVLSDLQDNSRNNANNNTFARHVLALSGASGGSVGTATFYSMLANKPSNATYFERSRAFLKEDFLSPVVTHLLGSDIIQHIVPLWWLGIGDRAQALEEAMEYFDDEPLDNAFGKPLSSVMDTSGKLPMLFINTTNVQQGAPAVVSTIQLDDFSQRMDVLDLVGEREDLRFSTAVVLGARFPYISPGGSIGKNYFVDGGYFDNTGSGIVHEMLQKLDSLYLSKTMHPDDTALYKKLSFKLIHLRNSPLDTPEVADIHPLINDLTAPLLTVLGTYSSQTDVNNQRLINFLKKIDPTTPGHKISLELNLYVKNDTTYPINWVISDYNLNRMNRRVINVRDQRESKEILSSLVPKK